MPRSPLRLLVPSLSLLVVLAGCAPSAAPFHTAAAPKRAKLAPLQRFWRVDAQPQYAAWWAKTEACAGKKRKMKDVTFFAVDARDGWVYLGEQRALAWWVRDGDRIFLPRQALQNEMLVRHEMLHAITRQARHRNDPFVTRCHVASLKTWTDSTLTVDPENPEER